ncbi:hypothetical protein AAEU28_08060 [Pseudoalteromonas sp. SS15]|uniref:hypothetical protein n=1 Tax=Pseudoalteromonas sp. SS15 TaxID=3139393 RepID=UPI003BACC94A
MATNNLPKGEQAEELLRQYFLSLGYFVVRSIDCKYQGYDVTDVDLWLYSRPSPISRERTNVDVKMKKTPQALERIFWTKGLQNVLGLEKCVVATTDKRSHIVDFGVENDVLVFDGNFMTKLNSSERYSTHRVTENELFEIIENARCGEIDGDWKKKYITSKSTLLNELNFDGANHILKNVGYFLEQLSLGIAPEASLRLLYVSLAHFLLCIDYLTKDISYKEPKERHNFISNGIRYGEQGESKALDLISTSSKLISSFSLGTEISAKSIEKMVLQQYQTIPSELLAEYFSNTKVMKNLFSQAKAFESLAMRKELISPNSLEGELQADIGLLCDFFGLDRRKLL